MRILRNFSNSINKEKIFDMIKKYKPHSKIYFEESDYDKILYPIKDKHDLLIYPNQRYSAQNDGSVKIEFTICLFLHDAENTEKILNAEVTGKLLCDMYEKLLGWSRYSNEVMLSNLLEGKWN